jgi:DHA2 family multidrug resistance protein
VVAVSITLGTFGSYLTLFYNLHIDMGWVIWPGFIRGLGLGLISIPLFTIAFSSLTRQETAEGSGIFNLMRNLGGSVGIALVTTIISEYTQVAWNQMGGHITPYTPMLALVLHGHPATAATAQTLALILGRHAAMRGILDAFVFVFWGFIIMLPLVLLMGNPKTRHSVELVVES